MGKENTLGPLTDLVDFLVRDIDYHINSKFTRRTSQEEKTRTIESMHAIESLNKNFLSKDYDIFIAVKEIVTNIIIDCMYERNEYADTEIDVNKVFQSSKADFVSFEGEYLTELKENLLRAQNIDSIINKIAIVISISIVSGGTSTAFKGAKKILEQVKNVFPKVTGLFSFFSSLDVKQYYKTFDELKMIDKDIVAALESSIISTLGFDDDLHESIAVVDGDLNTKHTFNMKFLDNVFEQLKSEFRTELKNIYSRYNDVKNLLINNTNLNSGYGLSTDTINKNINNMLNLKNQENELYIKYDDLNDCHIRAKSLLQKSQEIGEETRKVCKIAFYSSQEDYINNFEIALQNVNILNRCLAKQRDNDDVKSFVNKLIAEYAYKPSDEIVDQHVEEHQKLKKQSKGSSGYYRVRSDGIAESIPLYDNSNLSNLNNSSIKTVGVRSYLEKYHTVFWDGSNIYIDGYKLNKGWFYYFTLKGNSYYASESILSSIRSQLLATKSIENVKDEGGDFE